MDFKETRWTYVSKTNKMHIFFLKIYFNKIILGVFQITVHHQAVCTSSLQHFTSINRVMSRVSEDSFDAA